jgi:hypothetical protein
MTGSGVWRKSSRSLADAARGETLHALALTWVRRLTVAAVGGTVKAGAARTGHVLPFPRVPAGRTHGPMLQRARLGTGEPSLPAATAYSRNSAR